MIADPSADIRRARIKHVVQRIQPDRDARRARRPLRRRQRPRRIENQHRVRKISRAKNSDRHQKSPKGNWQRFQSRR